MEGPRKGASFEIADGVEIGRASSCGICLDGAHLSRVHARVVRRDGRYVLVDAGSRNGVFVNGEKVVEKLLEAGDEIEVGEHVLLFDPPGGKEAEPLRPLTTTVLAELRIDAFSAGKLETDALRLTLETVRSLLAADVEQDFLKVLLDRFVGAVKPARAFAMRADARGNLSLAAKVAPSEDEDVRLSNVIYHKVSKERKAVLATDAARRGDSERRPAALLAAPLGTPGRFLGFVYADTPVSDPLPFSPAELEMTAGLCAVAGPLLERVGRLARAREAVAAAFGSLQRDVPLIFVSESMRVASAEIEAAAVEDGPVLILGEPGAGRTHAARAIHVRSPRALGPFVVVDCRTNGPAVLDEILFERARGGTLLIENLADADPEIQARLARLLEAQEMEAEAPETGATEVRVLATGVPDVLPGAGRPRFLQELYRRAARRIVKLPPLRERREDIPALARHFMERNGHLPRATPEDRVDAEAWRCLQTYAWPGNVRELQQVIETAARKAPAEGIAREHLPPEFSF